MDWWSLVQGAVGAMGVVVVDVLDDQRSELVFIPDQGPVQEFVANGANSTHRSAKAFALGARGGVVSQSSPRP